MKAYIATIAWRSLHPTHVFSLIDTLTRAGLLWGPVVGDALVERSRGRCATDFLLRSGADVLLSIDTDIVFRPEDALAVCTQAVEHRAIVAGVYMTRNRTGGHPTSKLLMDRRYDFALTDDPMRGELAPIQYAAGGFMAVPRAVFEALAPALPLCDEGTALEQYPFYLPFAVAGDDGKPTMLSEDWALCERASRAGFPILANLGVRLQHVGEETFTLEDMLLRPVPTQSMAITRTAAGFQVDHAAVGVG